MTIGEFELIDRYFTGIGPGDEAVALGIGDDCALFDCRPGEQLAISVDTLVAGVHFPAAADAYRIAQRALRVNLSDLAAMGARPFAFTLALTLPAADETWLAAFSRGLRDAAQAFGITLIGGNTTRGRDCVINIQVMGGVPAGAALLRSGARPGDAVLVSGCLGDARAALPLLEADSAALDAGQRYLLDRYFQPEPRVALGVALRGIASAAIDISDGLAADLGHILAASDVGAVIDPALLPLSPALRGGDRAREFALHGGDDYELCCTVPPDRLAAAQAAARQLAVPLTVIGAIGADRGLRARGADGALTPLPPHGYRHF